MIKINAMHAHHGVCSEQQCKNCCNYITYRYRDRTMRKCVAYGDTRSQSTDWTGKYMACGLFGKPFDGDNQLPMIKRKDREKGNNVALPGQLTIMEMA